MTRLQSALDADRFVVTCELTPPKGTDAGPLVEKALALRGLVDAFNLTDSHGARMAMTPLAAAHLLIDAGAEPIVQMTTRDRNRIALQADLLGAWALGVRNVAFMGGDPPSNGDHPDAKGVFDVFAAALISAVRGLEHGADMGGNPIDGAPRFCVGAVVNPGASDLDGELRRMEEKLEAGASFFQTQAVYDAGAFERFVERVRPLGARLLAGLIPIKSPAMAEYMNAKVPGVSIPDALVAEIADAPDRAAASVAQAARIARAVRPLCAGVHVMTIGWEDKVPAILEQAGLARG